MSGDRVHLVGDALAAVVHGLASVHQTQASPPVVIGGLAVLCRLSTPHRATTDLDIVDRLLGPSRQLAATDDQLARDVRQHTDHWFVEHRRRSMTWIGRTGLAHGIDEDTLALVAELVQDATGR